MRKLPGEKGKDRRMECSCLALVQGLSIESERDINAKGEEEKCRGLQD